MELKLAGFLLPLLLVLPVKGTILSRNDTSLEDARMPRTNRRVVRLYSSTRPKPIVCEGEGFQADPTDCTIFHRCMKNGNGRYVSFRFQCGPGTIYDSDKEICNHPQSTKRIECGASQHVSSLELSIDNEISREIPTPLSSKRPEDTGINHGFSTQVTNPWISTSHPSSISAMSVSNLFINKKQQTKSPKPSSIKREITASSYSTTPLPTFPQKRFSTTATIDFQNSPLSSQSGDICKSNGFMGNSENCRKFYRCISNQRGGFIRYEFLCSDPTIWDDDKQACNHEWAVKRRRCGRGSLTDDSNHNQKYKQQINMDYGSKVIRTPTQIINGSVIKNQTSKTSLPTQTQLQINYGSEVSQTQTQINNGSVIQNQTQINYGDNNNNDKLSIKQNQTQISHGDAVSQTQTQINYGDKAVQTQLQIDHLKESSQAQTQVSQFSTTTKTTQFNDHQPISTTSSYNECTKSGFIGDSKDCKKFYRCVNNGRGFTRYEFSCAEGTVWDSKIDACNHAWAVKECGGKGSSETTAQSSTITTQSTTKVSKSPSTLSTTTILSTKTTTTTQSYHSSTEPESEDNNDIPYGNQPLPLSTNSPIQQTPAGNKEPQIQNDNKCKSSGFMSDNKDCKKFYRCVDNGNGGYTRYEFTCGEGTVWDQRIEACNHVWAVENCGGNTDVENHTEKSTTVNVIHTTSIQTTSQTPPQNVDYDTGYGQQPQHDEPSSTIHTSTLKSTTTTSQSLSPSDSTNVGNTCTSSGFMEDNNDCKKFYRCVDNGNGGYIRYDFSCGEGTVWDQKIQACNHAWAVEKCGGNAFEDINKVETTTRKEIEISSLSTTPAYKPSDVDNAGYGQQSQEPQSTSSTTSHLDNQNSVTNECKTSGFMSDRNDCKIFYRCVDNGDGTFTRYEFSCGEGTVWDSKIDACNHAWAVEKCGSANISNTSDSTLPINNEENSGSYPIQSDEYPNQTTTSSAISTSTSPGKNNICNTSGFMSNTQDCKKFYRCVEDGRGGYTRYEFTCGEGTVWDQSIEACNHAWAVSGRCSPSGNYNDSSDVKPTTQPHTPETELSSSATTQEILTTKRPGSTSTVPGRDRCTMEGFFANTNNCNKFHRCVDNGKGGFTKYDFDCGEGTVWVQEIQACDYDNGISSCSSKPQTMEEQQSSSPSQTTTETHSLDKEDDEYPSESSSKQPETDEICSSEGFFGHKKDCTKFYRCVDNGQGGYTKYDFTCGDGTAWDSNIQTCNHISEVETCQNNNEQIQSQPSQEGGSSQSTESTSTTKETTSSESSTKPSSTSDDKCDKEGYFGNTKDCTMFYRCVDTGKGGYTKYDFTCGEGTIWDQDLTTCNHPQDVTNPSCKNGEDGQLSSENSSSTESSSSISSSSSTSQSSQGTTESSNQGSSNCSEESSSKKPGSHKVKCEKAGFFADPDDCKKFYRCVDWDGDGTRFSVYHFDCGEGTIWDPQLETCNHEDSVYPPRDCSGTQSQTENVSQETTSSSTVKPTASEQSSTTETTSTTQSTTEESTTQQSSSSEQTSQATTTEKTTTQEQSTSEQTTTEKTTTTTQQSTSSEKTTTQQSTTSEKTTTQPTPTEQTTTEQTTSSEQTTTELTTQQSTTKEQTTQSSSSEQTTQQMTTSEQTTQSSSSEQTTTQQPSTTEDKTDSTTTEQQSTTTDQSSTTTEQSSEQNTTEQQTTIEQENTTTEVSTMTTLSSESTTTEGNQGTTSQETSSEKDCPETEDDQYLYVCPTSFRRHPKYCDMFYQCTENDDSRDVKITMFKCPNNTIYDETQTQCLKEDEAEKKCDGEKAQRHRVKRLNSNFKEPIQANRHKHSCSTVGNYPFDTDNECSGIFLKCQTTKSNKLRGYVYRCPEGYTYWSISKRCEKKEHMIGCKQSDRSWRDRWEIPLEKKNLAK